MNWRRSSNGCVTPLVASSAWWGQGAAANAFVPLAFELGEAYQFDWSEEGLVVGGIYYRAQVSHMKTPQRLQVTLAGCSGWVAMSWRSHASMPS